MASVEAQQLVALSLGKIAASRATRSGINLHKSLLVSSVLYKARTAILMEKYRASMVDYSDNESDTTSGESDISEEQSLECKEASAPAEGEMTDNNNQTGQDGDAYSENLENDSEIPEDKENVRPSCEFTTPSVEVKSPLNASCVLGSTENILTKSSQDSDKEITKCERCTKRRLSSVDGEDSDSSPVKRVKQDENTPVRSQSSDCDEQPMDQTQITHLVDSFNSGFDSLLSTPNCVSQQVQTCTDYNIGISPKSQVQGFSEAFSYCSSQIKESFDTLTSPIIALTV